MYSIKQRATATGDYLHCVRSASREASSTWRKLRVAVCTRRLESNHMGAMACSRTAHGNQD